jgi:glucan 1,3-beta-glucosidase
VAVAVSATASGILLGVAGDKMFYESYGVGGWLRWGLLLAAGMAAPLLAANALMSGRALPTFLELIGPREGRTRSILTMALGLTLIVTTVIAAETALGFAFDPRYRDFPFAALTMAVVPFSALMLLNRPQSGTRPIAEAAFAGLLVAAALYTVVNEGPENWQSLWTCALYLLLGVTLWQARGVQIPK